MAVQIRIVPEGLRDVALKQRDIVSRVEELGNRLKQLVIVVDEAWDGNSSNILQESLENVANATVKLGETMNQNISRIDDVVNAMEAIDSDTPIFRGKINIPSTIVVCPRPSFLDTISWKEDRIRIIPEEIVNAATRCREASEEYMEIKQLLQNSVTELEQHWEGNSYNKYRTECEEIINNMESFHQTLSEISSKMRVVALRFEELDNNF